MADSASSSVRVPNFLKLHFQKMELELKCPKCLDRLSQPMLLPCDHIFCGSCIPNLKETSSTCPACNCHYVDKDLRRTPHMENMLSIYKSIEAALGVTHFQRAPPANTTGGHLFEDHNPGRNLNQMPHTAPCSPPSFGETKDSDDNRSEHAIEHSAKRMRPEGTSTKETEVDKDAEIFGTNSNGEEYRARETKRQKLEFGHQNMVSNAVDHVLPNNLDAGNSSKLHSETGHKLKNLTFGAQSATPHSLHANPAFVCAFCQSSKVTEVHGPMLHYLRGKPVESDKVTRPNVLHIHTRCLEWAPRVYYDDDGETVNNLESEIARAAKLKCSECGLKGAALGCLAKSCRKSFHVPCAVYLDECRWDMDNFYMLCPTHSSQKFPNERSKSRKMHNGMRPCSETACQQPKTAFSSTAKEWIICASDLSSPEKKLLLNFATITGATISKTWDPNVTHIIAATDEKGAFRRTLKVLMGILNGRWILSIDWIKASIEAMNPLNEEPYEVNVDVHGCFDGPKNGRLRIMEKEPKLFNGLRFNFCGDFDPCYKHDLEELVKAAGGTIFIDDPTSQGAEEAETSKSLVVYSLDFPPEYKTKDRALLRKQRQEEAEAIAFRTRSWVVHHIWIIESIASLKLQPFSS